MYDFDFSAPIEDKPTLWYYHCKHCDVEWRGGNLCWMCKRGGIKSSVPYFCFRNTFLCKPNEDFGEHEGQVFM